MLGAIIGDIVGSRFEFNNAKSENFKLFDKGCDFTDDTICTCAIADAVLTDRDYGKSLQEWCRKYPNPMGGYGGSFCRWVFSNEPQPYNSYGNGSAMRVSPIGFLFDKAVTKEAIKSASVTHNHAQGIIGAVAVAEAIRSLRHGASIEDTFTEYAAKYCDTGIIEYKPFSNPFNETCMNAVPVAFACLRASTSFEDAIRKAIIVGGDSDTIGAIVGGMAEAAYGIPEDMKLTALEYLPNEIKALINKFYQAYKERSES